MFPGRVKLIEVAGKPYLQRFYLKHNGRLPGVYLHHFFRSDPDFDLHNHPWRWAFSLVLTGGYYEYRVEGWNALDHIEHDSYDRGVFSVNHLTGDTFHRVVLKDLDAGAWSLFVSGPENKQWGFMTYKGFIPCQLYWRQQRRPA